MKKIMLTTAFIAVLYTLQAQVLYGTTSEVNNGTGAICKLVTGESSQLTRAYTFDYSTGANPQYLQLLQASDGKLYGMTSEGGISNAGVIFSFDPATSTYKKLKDFNAEDGASPKGSLIQASNGKLYGMTYSGGTNNGGVIFSFDPTTSTYVKLKDLDSITGIYPAGSLMQASNGKLYGMTSGGGNYKNGGVLFSFNLFTSAYTKLKDLDSSTGRDPYGNLIQASNGKLYGMTSQGGTEQRGAIFSFDPSTSIYKKLKDFNTTDGSFPFGSLMQAADGKLYGMTSKGGWTNEGVIFSFDPVTVTYTNKKNLGWQDAQGRYPYGNLVQASDGKLYGITSAGGTSNKGVVFSFNSVSSVFTTLKDLSGADGINPYGSLILNSSGKLFGVTTNFTPQDHTGAIFSYNLSNSAYTVLKYLGANTNGSDMLGGLTKNSGKKLYGMTKNGGAYGQGTIFSYDATGGFFKKLWDMDYKNGSHPGGKLLLASDGKLYAITPEGGNGYGVIFSFDLSTLTFTKLKDLDYNTKGHPSGDLLEASDGKLYGTTTDRTSGYGTIFSFDPVSLNLTIRVYITYADGSPAGSLIQAANGKLYGTTKNGGINNAGVIFSFDPVTSQYKKLKDFTSANGANSTGSLLQASDGKLYGMTSAGGSNGLGVIFSFNPSTSKYTKLKDFKGSDGTHPYGSLVQGSDGKLYGLTGRGGKKGLGVAFSYDISSSTYTKLSDFTGANGSTPMYTSFVEIPCKKYYLDADGDGFGDLYTSVYVCEPQAGYVTDSTDCKDNDKTIYPNAPELCDGKDNDCDGVADEGCPVAVTVSIADTFAAESNSGKKQMVFTVKLNKTSQKQISVQYTTLNTTATGGSDYVKRSDTIFFAPGTKSNTIVISIISDTITEPDETFRIKLSNPVNAAMNDSIAIGTILNDDGAGLAATANNNAVASFTTGKYISLVPNPATDRANVVLTGYSGNIVIRLSNITGKSLQEKKMRLSSAKQTNQPIDVSNYVSGIYIITVFDEQGNSKTQKLVIEH